MGLFARIRGIHLITAREGQRGAVELATRADLDALSAGGGGQEPDFAAATALDAGDVPDAISGDGQVPADPDRACMVTALVRLQPAAGASSQVSLGVLSPDGNSFFDLDFYRVVRAVGGDPIEQTVMLTIPYLPVGWKYYLPMDNAGVSSAVLAVGEYPLGE